MTRSDNIDHQPTSATGSVRSSIDLAAAFGDTPGEGPFFAIIDVKNPELFSSIATSRSDGTLTIEYADGAAGIAVVTIRRHAIDGTSVDQSFSFSVGQVLPEPAVAEVLAAEVSAVANGVAEYAEESLDVADDDPVLRLFEPDDDDGTVHTPPPAIPADLSVTFSVDEIAPPPEEPSAEAEPVGGAAPPPLPPSFVTTPAEDTIIGLNLAAVRKWTGRRLRDAAFVPAAIPTRSPERQWTDLNTPLVFRARAGNAISVADADSLTGFVEVLLKARSGSLTLSHTYGLSFTLGDGRDDQVMQFSGPVTLVNAALEGLKHQPRSGYCGTAWVQVIVADAGDDEPFVNRLIPIDVRPDGLEAPDFDHADDLPLDLAA